MRRKGEISLGRVKREWPHHVAIRADRVMGNGYDLVHGFAKTLSVGPRTYGFRRDDVDYVAFCFADPAHAEQFRERFDGGASELMAKVVKLRPEPPARPIRRDIYRAAAKARLIGTVEAPTADDAIKAAAAEYQVPDPRKLIAVRRP